MTITQHSGKLDSPGVFEIRCSICDRVYIKMFVPESGEANYEFEMPQVPCHADGLNIGPPEEDPFARVLRLLDPDGEAKRPEDTGNYEYTVTGIDGMIQSISVRRVK